MLPKRESRLRLKHNVYNGISQADQNNDTPPMHQTKTVFSGRLTLRASGLPEPANFVTCILP